MVRSGLITFCDKGLIWCVFLLLLAACNSFAESTPTLPPGVSPSPTPLHTAVLPSQTPLTFTMTPTPTTTTATGTPLASETNPTLDATTSEQEQACVIQPPSNWVSYQVRQGDTLVRLAQQGGVSSDDLKRVNCRTSDDIFAGELLFLPAGTVPQPPTEPLPTGLPPTAEQPAPPPTAEQPAPLPTLTFTATPEPPTPVTPVEPPEPPTGTEQPPPQPLSLTNGS